MTGAPVLQNKDEIRIWKHLGSGTRVPSEKSVLGAIDEIRAYDGTLSAPLLVRALELMDQSEGDIDKDAMNAILSKSRVTDCSPAIRAAEMMLSRDDWQYAERVISGSKSHDPYWTPLVMANISLKEGDIGAAVEYAKRAYGVDPSEPFPYMILKEAEPEGGWAQRENIQAVFSGEQPPNPPSEGGLQELYAIYYEWFRGDREAATDRLINSERYAGKDPEYLLLSARMSVDEKDWRSAGMIFDKLVDGDSPDFVICEAAEAYIAGQEPEYALKLLSKADQSMVRVMRDRVNALAGTDRAQELSEAVRTYVDNEYSATDEYLAAVKLLISLDQQAEAGALLERVKLSNPNDPSVLSLESVLSMKSGDVRGAKAAARKAALLGRKDASAGVQKARMYLISGDPDRAEKMCDRILGKEPDNIDALILKRDILVGRNRIGDAIDVCQRILRQDPGDAATMMALSGAMGHTGNGEGAMEMISKVLQADPSRDNVIAAVSTLISSKLYREAMYMCYDRDKEFPDDPLLKRLRGNAEYALGEYMKASVSYAAAAQLSPHDPVLWHSKGMADEARGDLQSAEEAYNRAVLLDLGESEFWMSKAAVQERLGDNYGAVESLNRAIELDPGSVLPLARKAAILAADGRYDEALHFLNIASAVDPSNGNVVMMRARILSWAGRSEEAITLAKTINSMDRTARSAILLSECLEQSGDAKGAVKIVDDAIGAEPGSLALIEEKARLLGGVVLETDDHPNDPDEDPEALFEIASSLYNTNDYKGAMRDIDHAISLAGEDTRYGLLKVRILMATGDGTAAEDLVSELIKKDPKSAELFIARGDIMMSASQYREAVRDYDNAIKLGATDVEALIRRGDAYQALGNPDKSIDSYIQAVTKAPRRLDLQYVLASKFYARGNRTSAEQRLDHILNADPSDKDAILLLAQIASDKGDDAKLTEAYDLFCRTRRPSRDDVSRMVGILESSGHTEEARSLADDRSNAESQEDKSVKRSSEKALRRAYTSSNPPDDMDLLFSLGFDDDMAMKVRDCVRDIPAYGEIRPGTSDFQRMEKQSHDVLMKLGRRDIEGHPGLQLEEVFVTGGYRDIDDAKRLVAYVGRAMEQDVGHIADTRLEGMADRIPKGTPLYDIMDMFGIGIYEARIIQSMIV